MQELAAWATLICALAAFLFSHAIPARPVIRRRLTAVLGERNYLVLYSLLSLLLLVWLVQATRDAPFVELWAFADWQRHVPGLLVPLSFALAATGLATPNPLSLSAARRPFDPARPGVIAVTRHPLMLAFALWAAAHIVPNGDLAHVILFGTFLGLALGGMRILDRRARRRLGDESWHELARRHPILGWPRVAWIDRPTLLAALIGFVAALLFATLHGYIIGVPALAP